MSDRPRMSLQPGTRLGPYEIMAPLGAGGMGEVYRARDPRLGRDVAIKVIPAELSTDPERIKRFQQEARVAGSLSHPNLCTTFDVGAHEGTPFVVMELLSGATLRERLARGPVPPREAARWAMELAQGLAAAHEKAIVHRDLKPENVFVTKEGHVKILDFGLAKLLPALAAASAETDTMSGLRTMSGAILGTPGYMAPEQLRGEHVDHRADLFALGAILYEMLTGRRAFRGDSLIDTGHAILNEDPPPPSATVPALPAGLGRQVMRALEKDPARRCQSARDLAFSLEEFATPGATEASAASVPTRRPAGRIALRIAVVAVSIGAAVAGGWWLSDRLGSGEAPQFSRLSFSKGIVNRARFAREGGRVYYSAAWSGRSARVFVVDPGSTRASRVDIPDAVLLAVSSRHEMAVLLNPVLGSRTGAQMGTLAIVPASGGAPKPTLERVIEADWAPDGTTLAVVRSEGGRVALEWPLGHEVHRTSGGISGLRISPRGDRIAFFEHPQGNDDGGRVVTIGSDGKTHVLLRNWYSLRGLAWRPDGREIWFTGADGTPERKLWAITPEGRRRHLLAVPGTLTLQDISDDGSVLLLRGSDHSSILFRPLDGSTDTDLDWGSGMCTDLSPGGRQALMTEAGLSSGVQYATYLQPTDGSDPVRLGEGLGLSLSPDGRWALACVKGPPMRLVRLPTGPGTPRPVGTRSIEGIEWGRFTPDGRTVVFVGNEPGRPARVHAVAAEGGEVRALTPEGIVDVNTISSEIISPDGRSVLVSENDSTCTRYPIFEGTPEPVRGLKPGDFPVEFTSDGKEIFVVRTIGAGEFALAKLDPTTGGREPWRDVRMTDPTGVWGLSAMRVTRDGRFCAYTVWRGAYDLYRVDGLK